MMNSNNVEERIALLPTTSDIELKIPYTRKKKPTRRVYVDCDRILWRMTCIGENDAMYSYSTFSSLTGS